METMKANSAAPVLNEEDKVDDLRITKASLVTENVSTQNDLQGFGAIRKNCTKEPDDDTDAEDYSRRNVGTTNNSARAVGHDQVQERYHPIESVPTEENSNSNNAMINQPFPGAMSDKGEPGQLAWHDYISHSITLTPRAKDKKQQHGSRVVQPPIQLAKVLPNAGEIRKMLREYNHDSRRRSLGREPSVMLFTDLPTAPKSAHHFDVQPDADDLLYTTRAYSSKTRYSGQLKKREKNKPTKKNRAQVQFMNDPTPVSLEDMGCVITLPSDPSQRMDIQRRFDNFSPNFVLFDPVKDKRSVKQQNNWLDERRKLSLTHQTPHVEVQSTNREFHRADSKKAFATARIPVAFLKPGVIAGMPGLASRSDGPYGRCQMWWNTIKMAKSRTPSWFFSYTGYDRGKIEATVCFFQSLAPAHLDPEPRRRLFQESMRRNQEEQRELERQRQANIKRLNKFTDTSGTTLQAGRGQAVEKTPVLSPISRDFPRSRSKSMDYRSASGITKSKTSDFRITPGMRQPKTGFFPGSSERSSLKSDATPLPPIKRLAALEKPGVKLRRSFKSSGNSTRTSRSTRRSNAHFHPVALKTSKSSINLLEIDSRYDLA